MSAQVPILPVFSDAVLHIAGFLSQNLPPSLDTIVPPTYVRQALALRETQLRKLVDDLDVVVHSSALATAAWVAQIDALIFPQRSVPYSLNVQTCGSWYS